MPRVDVATVLWLRGPDGAAAIDHASSLLAREYDDLAALAALRRTTDAERAAAALSQARLRQRAAAVFGEDAERMLFTHDGLEQATRPRVAAHRAARIALGGQLSVVDLGCGIGGDLIPLARAGLTVAGVDVDPVRAALAEANLMTLGLDGAVVCADAAALDLSPFTVVLATPSRHGGGPWSARDWAPPWGWVTDLLASPACVSLASDPPAGEIPADVEMEWVSDHGVVREVTLWSSWLATARRRATVLGSAGLATLTEADLPGAAAEARPRARYVYAVDEAVVRAGLVGAVAALVGGGVLADDPTKVTSERQVATPFARLARL